MPLALSKSCTGIPSERVSEVRLPRNELCPQKKPKLSCEASLNLRNGFSSKMNQNPKELFIYELRDQYDRVISIKKVAQISCFAVTVVEA